MVPSVNVQVDELDDLMWEKDEVSTPESTIHEKTEKNSHFAVDFSEMVLKAQNSHRESASGHSQLNSQA